MSGFLKFHRKILLGAFGLMILLDILAWQEVFMLVGPRYLKVDVLDVGQGDSIFIRTSGGRQILIDGGPDSSVMRKLAKRMPIWDKSLDVVVLTHPDADHVIGLLRVLKKYKVDYIVWTGIERNGGNYREWVSLLEKKKRRGSRVILAKSGDMILSGGTAVTILHPFKNLEGQFFDKNGNDTGIVSRLKYGDKSFLFAADVSSAIERGMIDRQINLASDVLKVPHHGSKYSSSEEFLQAMRSEIAVISAGKSNPYGHPTPEVLQRLDKFGIKVLRTDRDGDIQFLSDGESIIINSKSKSQNAK